MTDFRTYQYRESDISASVGSTIRIDLGRTFDRNRTMVFSQNMLKGRAGGAGQVRNCWMGLQLTDSAGLLQAPFDHISGFSRAAYTDEIFTIRLVEYIGAVGGPNEIWCDPIREHSLDINTDSAEFTPVLSNPGSLPSNVMYSWCGSSDDLASASVAGVMPTLQTQPNGDLLIDRGDALGHATTVYVQPISFLGSSWTLTQQEFNFAATTAFLSITIPVADPDSTVPLFTARATGSGFSSLIDNCMRFFISATDTAIAAKTGTALIKARVYFIENPDLTIIRPAVHPYPSGSTTSTQVHSPGDAIEGTAMHDISGNFAPFGSALGSNPNQINFTGANMFRAQGAPGADDLTFFTTYVGAPSGTMNINGYSFFWPHTIYADDEFLADYTLDAVNELLVPPPPGAGEMRYRYLEASSQVRGAGIETSSQIGSNGIDVDKRVATRYLSVRG